MRIRAAWAALLGVISVGSVGDSAAEGVWRQPQFVDRDECLCGVEFTGPANAGRVQSGKAEDQSRVMRFVVERESIGHTEDKYGHQAFIGALLPGSVNFTLWNRDGHTTYKVTALEDRVAVEPSGFSDQLAGNVLFVAEFEQINAKMDRKP